jgi:superfamily I DNA/RNA helicase
LAIEKACGLDLQDKRVLFLCFNKSLKRWLQILVTDAIDGGATFRDFVYIGHFHMFARNAAKKAGLQFPQKPTDDWWGSGAAALLDKSIDTIKQADSFRPYDALVVDEAQDFHQSWWRPLLSKAITPDADVWLFSDTNQAIHQEDPVPPPLEGAEVFTLTKVVRSTRRIAAAGRSVSGAPFPIDGIDPTPAGADVELSFVENEIDGRERVMALVESLLKEGINPNQLVLINPNVHAKGWLKDIDRIAQWKIGDTDDLASWHKGDTLLNTTPRSFKGLEAPVVILYGLAGFAGWFNEKDLYVAITRARSRLYVLAIASCSPTMRSRLDNAAKIANAITAE